MPIWAVRVATRSSKLVWTAVVRSIAGSKGGARGRGEGLLGAIGDEPGDGQRGGRAGRGGVADVQRALGLAEHEVVDQAPVAGQGLGAHAGEGGLDVADPQLGDVARGGADERAAPGGVAQLD